MTIVLILFLFCLTLSAVLTDEITFHKVRVKNNPANRLSIRMYTHSPEMSLMHATIRFYTNVSNYHNSLILDRTRLSKYKQMTRDSPIEYGNSMTMIMKSDKKTFSYTIVSDMKDNIYTTVDNDKPYYSDVNSGLMNMFNSGGGGMMMMSSSGVGQYDGVLLLDKYSSIWDEYNTVIFGRNYLTLKYHDRESGDVDDDGDNDGIFDGVEDFSQLVHLNCRENVLLAPCEVTLPYGENMIIVNSVNYTGIKLVVDFNSAFNYLPVELYAQWMDRPEETMMISLTETTHLPLSTKFQFMMHEDSSSSIILGVDLIHHFPKVAYSQGVDNRIRIWYYSTVEESYETHQTVATIFTFINALTITGLFIWGTSYNFYTLSYIVNFERISRKRHYFAQKQVFVELLVILIAVLQWILVLVFSWNSNYFSLFTYSSAYADRRKVIFLLYSLYQSSVGLCIICLERSVFKKALEIYTPRLYALLFNRPMSETSRETREKLNEIARKKEFIDEKPKSLEELDIQIYSSTLFLDIPLRATRERLYRHIIKHYHDPLITSPTDLVIMRNLKLILIILSNLMVSYNFQSEYNNAYLLLVVAMVITSLVFTILYFCTILIHMQKFVLPIRQNKLLSVYTLCELVVFIGFTVFSFNPVYLVYFDALNTGHSSTTLTIYTLVLLTLIVIFSIEMALRPMITRNERLIEYKSLRDTLNKRAYY